MFIKFEDFKSKIVWMTLLVHASYTVCTIMVIYQVSCSMVEYFTNNPTLTSTTTRPLQPEDLPSIQLCPIPGWNMEKIKKSGYRTPYRFYNGKVECISKENKKVWFIIRDQFVE